MIEEDVKDAAYWDARLRSDEITRQEIDAFKRWLATGDNELTFLQLQETLETTRRLYLSGHLTLKLPQLAPPAPPLSRLAQVMEFFVTARHYANVIAPQIADVQEEYAEARNAGNVWLARWIVVRGLISLVHKPLWLWLLALIYRAVDAIFKT